MARNFNLPELENNLESLMNTCDSAVVEINKNKAKLEVLKSRVTENLNDNHLISAITDARYNMGEFAKTITDHLDAIIDAGQDNITTAINSVNTLLDSHTVGTVTGNEIQARYDADKKPAVTEETAETPAETPAENPSN